MFVRACENISPVAFLTAAAAACPGSREVHRSDDLIVIIARSSPKIGCRVLAEWSARAGALHGWDLLQ
jgi:hypothetical protein